jgi:hypothetical protein
MAGEKPNPRRMASFKCRNIDKIYYYGIGIGVSKPGLPGVLTQKGLAYAGKAFLVLF